MAYLISLDKKLLTIQHRFNDNELTNLMAQHTLTKEQLIEELQRQLYQSFMQGIAKNIPTHVETVDGINTYTVSGYVLSQRDVMYLIKEICELDEVARNQFLTEINKKYNAHP